MENQLLFTYFILYACAYTTDSQSIVIEKNGISLSITAGPQKLQLSVKQGATEKLKGELGVGLAKDAIPCEGLDNCLEIGNSRLHVTTEIDSAFTIFWTNDDEATIFEDCFELAGLSWYGGPERVQQEWPLDKLVLTDFPNVVKEQEWGAVTEPYWLNSAGAYIFVDEKVPLFINQNSEKAKDKVCFSAKSAQPYLPRNKIGLQYTIGVAENAREGHLHAVQHFLGKPKGHPNYRVIERPIWSTWARYKRDINDTVLLQYAQEIADNGYPYGQFEIDDYWEECYGALTFSKEKFSDITNTVKKIKEHNFTVTLWVHPFVNLDCKKYIDMGRKYNFFVKNTKGSDLTGWWNSKENEATYWDFTKAEVRALHTQRLRALQENHGIDSFKFDAGESNWVPELPVLNGDVEIMPNNIVVDFVRMCASFGDLIEVRAAWKTQDLQTMLRMLDKSSDWGHNNGLYTLITTLLQMNLNGYSMVLPDMVGGNGYQGAPSAELFVRWLQANTFMPTIQFSYVPWDYDDGEFSVKEISRKFVNLHQKYAPIIQKQMRISIEIGHPVNAPIWWVDPTDTTAQKMDTEFLLGEDILVAPVIEDGARSRNIYLPKGVWVDGNDGTVHEGPKSIPNYDAPIEILPYFIRQGSNAIYL